jgi:hypothetical protein
MIYRGNYQSNQLITNNHLILIQELTKQNIGISIGQSIFLMRVSTHGYQKQVQLLPNQIQLKIRNPPQISFQ